MRKYGKGRGGDVSVNTPIARYRGPSYPSRARPVIGNVGVVSRYKIIRKVVVAAGTEDGPCRMRSGRVKCDRCQEGERGREREEVR